MTEIQGAPYNQEQNYAYFQSWMDTGNGSFIILNFCGGWPHRQWMTSCTQNSSVAITVSKYQNKLLPVIRCVWRAFVNVVCRLNTTNTALKKSILLMPIGVLFNYATYGIERRIVLFLTWKAGGHKLWYHLAKIINIF